MKQQAQINHRTIFSSDIPKQLEIRGNKLVMIGTGNEPMFDLPDGTIVNVVPHEDLKRIYDDVCIARAWAS